MRRPPATIPLGGTVLCFVPFLLAVSVRIGFLREEWPVLEGKLLAGIAFTAVVWAVYGLICAFSRR